MRLFIAIDFNELNDSFIGLQAQLPKNAKLSFVKSFHLKLKFLGEVQPNRVDEVAGILKTIKFEAFNVFTDSIGIFPTENYIRVVWVGLKPESEILEVQKQIAAAVALRDKEEDLLTRHQHLQNLLLDRACEIAAARSSGKQESGESNG